MLTYEYKLYSNRRTASLDAMLREACFVWNHALALQRRYYSLYHGYVSCARMKAHFARRIHRCTLGAQTTQEILERLDASYKRFFTRVAKRPPKFRKAEHFRSFVFKQCGYKLYGNEFIVNKTGKRYRFTYSRPIEGKVKTVRIKRSPLGEYYLYVVTDAVAQRYHKTHDGAMVGMDFGLKTYLTLSDGTDICNPQFLKQDIKDLKRLSKALSKSTMGSNNRNRRRHELDRLHERIVNRRDDWQWKMAHSLCRKYDIICIENLEMTWMTRRWGRKVNDLAFSGFVSKLEHVASKYGVTVHRISRFYPSSKTCGCGYINHNLRLEDRVWTCPDCGAVNNRDLLAAKNILRQGIAELGSSGKTCLAGTGR